MNGFGAPNEHEGIWPYDERLVSGTRKDEYLFESNRAGGQYRISRHASVNLKSYLGTKGLDVAEELRARLATRLIDLRESGEVPPTIDVNIVDWLCEQSRSLPVSSRALRLLNFLVRTSRRIGDTIDISDKTTEERAFAWSESSDSQELEYLLNYLIETGRVKRISASGWYRVTVEGFEVIQKSKTEFDPLQVFVALWFNSETDLLWDAMNAAIRNAGYCPIRIDKEHFWGSIDDEVIANIRRAKFLVADLTHGEDGARGSVYFEAGFGMGLGKATILTVHEDFLVDEKPGKVHFDLQHHTILTWSKNSMQEFGKILQDRIESLFGRGAFEPNY